MLGRTLVFLVALTFSTPTSVSRRTGAWTKFSSVEGRFSVLLPGKATSDSEANELYTTHSVSAETDWATYQVAYFDYRAPLTTDRQQILNGARDGLLTTGKLTSERKITLDGYPGRELEFAPAGGLAQDSTRLFVVGKRLYKVSVVFAPANKYDSAQAEKFFSSFRITGSGADKKDA
jgi:hypothetical protein